jgi:uncharacterized protein (DUF952 family)
VQSIYHLVTAAEWTAACDCGRYAPESLAREGFIHFSFAHQVAATANLHYPERTDLVVIEVDPGLLPGPVLVEDLYSRDEEFPHFYGALPTAAAVGQHSLDRDADGRFVFAPDG